MEIFFNPYPGATQNRDVGIQCILDVADALLCLRNGLNDDLLSVCSVDNDLSLSNFIIIREAYATLQIHDVLRYVKDRNIDKIKLLLQWFSKGKIIDSNDMTNIENWILKNIGTAAPILEFAAKKSGIALTIPTEPMWRVDIIEFEGRKEILHNLWGQKDLSVIREHCINAINNVQERFSVRYNAKFCEGALNSAPENRFWDELGIFRQMDKAKKCRYTPDNVLIKKLENCETKYGPLYELRCLSTGLRLFFVVIDNASTEILVGGFYQKSKGIKQNEAIDNVCKRIDKHLNQVKTQ